MNPANQHQGSSLKDRLAKQQTGANAPTLCSVCGGSHAFEVNASAYNMSSYGARPVTSSPQRLIVCLCGHMQAVGFNGAAGPERSAFLSSLDIAKEHREKTNATSLIKNTASISEVEDLKSQLADLTARFTTLLEYLEQEHDSDEEVEPATDTKPTKGRKNTE